MALITRAWCVTLFTWKTVGASMLAHCARIGETKRETFSLLLVSKARRHDPLLATCSTIAQSTVVNDRASPAATTMLR